MKPIIAIILMIMLLNTLNVAAADRLDEGFVNPGAHEQPTWFKHSFLDLQEDVSEAATEKRRIALYFYQDGCPYCKKLLEINFSQKDIVEKTRQNFDVISINMWGDREVTDTDGQALIEKTLALKRRIMFTPTLIFLDEQGKEVLRINGYYAPYKFTTALDFVAGHHEKTTTYRDYFAKLNPVPAHGQLHKEAYFKPHPLNLTRGRAGGKYLMVMFEQKDCPACDELHGDILKRKETLDQLKRFDIAQVDVWSRDELVAVDGKTKTAAQWAKELDIKYTPSAIFFDDNGKEVFRMEAYLKAFHIQSSLDYVASGAFLKEPSFQRFIEKRGEDLRAKGVQVDLMR